MLNGYDLDKTVGYVDAEHSHAKKIRYQTKKHTERSTEDQRDQQDI